MPSSRAVGLPSGYVVLHQCCKLPISDHSRLKMEGSLYPSAPTSDVSLLVRDRSCERFFSGGHVVRPRGVSETHLTTFRQLYGAMLGEPSSRLVSKSI